MEMTRVLFLSLDVLALIFLGYTHFLEAYNEFAMSSYRMDKR